MLETLKEKVVVATGQRVLYKGNVDCTEAEAVNFGIQVAQNANFLPMIMQSGSEKVVDLSRNRKGSKTKIF